MFGDLLVTAILVGIILFFIVSLILWKKTPKDSGKYKSRKGAFIASSILAGILITIIILLFIDYGVFEGLFLFIPVGILIFFIVSLILLKKTPKDSGKYKVIKTMCITFAVLAGILVSAFVVLFIMTQMIIRYM
ncbi:MAG: hypothetical protein K2J39_08355 [Ruminococcus sp.]|nr:hypothetical protein [Ruminococcus sp.]